MVMTGLLIRLQGAESFLLLIIPQQFQQHRCQNCNPLKVSAKQEIYFFLFADESKTIAHF